MNQINIKAATARRVLVPLIVFILLLTSPITLADDSQRNCSLEVSIMAERIKDENPEKDWSFVILTGVRRREDISPSRSSSAKENKPESGRRGSY